jgi:hypothetical protein
MIVITGDIESIERDYREIEPIKVDEGKTWKQFEIETSKIVITGKNLNASSEIPKPKSLGQRVFEATGCMP